MSTEPTSESPATSVRIGPRLVPVHGAWRGHCPDGGFTDPVVPAASVVQWAWGPWHIATGRGDAGDFLCLGSSETGLATAWHYGPDAQETAAADAARLLAAAMLSGEGRAPALTATLHDPHTGATTGTIALFTGGGYDLASPAWAAATVVWFTADTAAVASADSVRTALEWWADDLVTAADEAEATGEGLGAPYGSVIAWQLRRQVHDAFARYDLGRLGEAIRAADGKRGDGVVIRAITGLSGTWYTKVRKGEEWPAWPYSGSPA